MSDSIASYHLGNRTRTDCASDVGDDVNDGYEDNDGDDCHQELEEITTGELYDSKCSLFV